MNNKAFSIGKGLKLAIFGTVLEGLLAGSNFFILFQVLELIFGKSITFEDIKRTTLMLGIIFVLRLILYTVSYTKSQIGGALVSKNLRVTLGDKLRRIPLGAFTKQRIGYYINASTSEVADYEQILTHKLADITKYVVLLVAVSLYSAFMNIAVGLIMLVSLLLLIPTIQLSIRQVKKYGKAKNLAREENVSAITEYLTGSQTLRSYGLAGEKNKSLRSSMKHYSNISYQYEGAVVPIGFVYMFLAYVAAAAIIFISVNGVVTGDLSIPEMITINMLSLYSCKVEAALYVSLVAYRNLLISKGKIAGILMENEEVKAKEVINPKHFNITFENVSFAYEKDQAVLKNISFEIPENKITAIVGESGSGKSTIFNLISKYYEPASGRIYIGGEGIGSSSTEMVLSNISMVDQDVFLFNDTVKNNLRFAAPKASDEEIENALKQANCDFVYGLENGLNTLIGENGNKLSGGERQRISVARAILRNSPIVLLDEATSSLDIENELLVKKAVLNLLKTKRTVVMIAHTLPIIQLADQILVVKDGGIAESGTHDELLAKNGAYAAMWQASSKLK
ncbi:MAG: ABC transporter ATP-binding protein [Pseudobutyrivibrio sp.]|uniref:ABC transporter ATP-binding protein n=1 Tax=Pseudobutyrivibrio sp. TaxID=2014367 RepID=UPI0025D63B41|nr:ABC transporter ATP-binding protein [Pseudobutyrivibrio sp.]MBQ8488296.1 ABC transporter ATP-binding protein [Pseudobutyrivibrio sp.]